MVPRGQDELHEEVSVLSASFLRHFCVIFAPRESLASEFNLNSFSILTNRQNSDIQIADKQM
jgi:hypothetical protein